MCKRDHYSFKNACLHLRLAATKAGLGFELFLSIMRLTLEVKLRVKIGQFKSNASRVVAWPCLTFSSLHSRRSLGFFSPGNRAKKVVSPRCGERAWHERAKRTSYVRCWSA